MPRTFTDARGQAWRIAVGYKAVQIVRERTGVNLWAFCGDDYERLAGDFGLLARVLWVLCEQQADPAGVSPELFGRSLADDHGQVMLAAATALLEATADSLPKPQRHKLLQAIQNAR